MPQKLEDFWNQQLIDIQFLKRFGIVEHNVQRVVLGTLNSFQEGSSINPQLAYKLCLYSQYLSFALVRRRRA